MPSIAENAKAFSQAKAAGTVYPVKKSGGDASLNPLSIPQNPPPNQPFFRNPLPATQWSIPAAERQWFQAPTSQLRLPPPAAAAQPAANASAASQAINIVNNSTNVGGTPGSLVMPTIFVVGGALPDTVNGGAVDVTLAAQPDGTFFAAPWVSSVKGLDQLLGSAGSGAGLISVGTLIPSASGEWALFAVGCGPSLSTISSDTPGLTNISGTTMFGGLISGSTYVASVTQSPSDVWSALLMSFYATGTPVASNGHTFSSGVLWSSSNSQTSTQSITVTAGDVIFVQINANNSTPAGLGIGNYSIGDNGGNIYQFVGAAGSAAFSSSVVWAATASSSGTITISVTFDQLAGSGESIFGYAACCSVSGLAASPGTGLPFFRTIRAIDLSQAVFGPSGSQHSVGAVPDPGPTAGSSRVLFENGVWGAPPATGGGATSTKITNYTAVSGDNGKLIPFNAGTATLSVVAVHESGTGSTAVPSISTSSFTAVAGDEFIVYIRWFQNSGQTISSVGDTPNGAYSQVGTNISESSTLTAIYGFANSTSGTVTPTVVFSASVTFTDVIVYQIRGASTSLPTNLTNATATDSPGVTSLSPTITTANANAMVLAFSTQDAFPFQNISFPAGTWTTNANGNTPASGGPFCNASYQIFSSIQTGMSVQSSWSTATGGIALLLEVPQGTSTVTLTLPATPPSTTWNIFVTNFGSISLTISPNGKNINGSSSSLTLASGQNGLYITTDGTNYFTA